MMDHLLASTASWDSILEEAKERGISASPLASEGEQGGWLLGVHSFYLDDSRGATDLLNSLRTRPNWGGG